MQPVPLNPACLPLGTRVGPWRILDLRGRGAYGAVYRAEGVDGEVALKLALSPRDDRFARETGLLSRLRHPAIPRLVDQGHWRSPEGQPHPYLVMEWLEGLPLYEWAHFRAASSRQVLQVLAGLARALEAIHAIGVHRDVKGSNVLVRLEDDQGVLIDFGSCHYRGAAPLTWQLFPPGTPAYRSPEAFRFERDASSEAPARPYAPVPAEDVFALGVTAYRLVTGQYPAPEGPPEGGFHVWNDGGTPPRPARELNARCAPELGALISRMMSLQPEARGSARELARALERAARRAGPEADVSLFGGTPSRPVRPASRRDWRPWLVAASLAGPMALAAVWALHTRPQEEASEPQAAVQKEALDAGTVAAGDSALTAQVASPQPRSAWSPIGLDMPSKPLLGQTRPDANGRCPSRMHVAINGGCWIEANVTTKDCERDGYVYKGRCYTPAVPLRPATSSPTDSRDGG